MTLMMGWHSPVVVLHTYSGKSHAVSSEQVVAQVPPAQRYPGRQAVIGCEQVPVPLHIPAVRAARLSAEQAGTGVPQASPAWVAQAVPQHTVSVPLLTQAAPTPPHSAASVQGEPSATAGLHIFPMHLKPGAQ